MAPYGACKSYKAEFEEVFVFVFLSFLCFCVFEQTRQGCSDMAFQRSRC